MFRSYSENIKRIERKSGSSPPQSNRFGCSLCDESWVTETDLELHRKAAHFDIIRSQSLKFPDRFCTVCMRLQKSYAELVTHVKTRHLYSSPLARRIEREIYICNHCDRIFFNKDMLRAHVMYSHMWLRKERKNKTFKCPKCKKLCRLKTIWFHLQLHEIPSLSVCDICLAQFPNSRELQMHLKEHPMLFRCETCDLVATKQVVYEMHLDHHRNGLQLPNFLKVCILCRELCEDSTEAKEHFLRDHHPLESAKKRWRCRCGEEFFNQVLLKHHIFKMKGEHRPLDDFEAMEQESMLMMPTIEVEVNSSGEWTLARDTSKHEVSKRMRRQSLEEEGDSPQYVEVNDLGVGDYVVLGTAQRDSGDEQMDEDSTVDSATNEEVIELTTV